MQINDILHLIKIESKNNSTINFLSGNSLNNQNKDIKMIRNLEGIKSDFPANPYDTKYGQAININCIPNKNCFSPNECIYNNTICNCSIINANYFRKNELNEIVKKNSTIIYCNYSRKRQLTAFWLTLFFNFGIAQFYIEHVHIGLIKLGIAIVSIILIPFAVFYKNPLLSMLVGLFFCFIISIWGLIDIILFGINYYDDGNDVPLQPW